jgi:MFS family permease
LWTATGISALGDGLVFVGFPLLALEMTSSALAIAMVAVAGRLPAFIFGLPAGVLADRVDRRRFVLLTNLARAAVLGAFAGFVVAGADNLAVVYVVIFILGSCEVAVDVTTQACLPVIVPRRLVPLASGYYLGADVSGEQFVGPAVGGLLFGVGAALPFVGDAASFVASAGLLARTLPGRPAHPHSSSRLADLREGLRWFMGHPMLRLLAMAVGSLAFCEAMVISLLVLFGTHDLGLSKTGYGVFVAIIAVGDVVGRFSGGTIYNRFGPARCLVGAGAAAASAYLIVAGVHSVVAAAGAFCLASFAIGVGDTAMTAVRQQSTPEELLGRVASVYRLVIFGLLPLGAIAGGLLANATSVRTTFVVAGIAQLLVLVVVGLPLLPHLRAHWAAERSVAA